jgi:type IV fimbrial biogenesis protein FimT
MIRQHPKPEPVANKACPFVCLYIPFVSNDYPRILPSVGIKIPFIRYGANKGFSLVELIIAVTVMAILGAIAAPGFLNFVRDNRLTTATNDLIGDMMLTRNEAIKRNTPVVICKTTDATVANPVCDGTAGNAWTNGWIVFVDTNDNGTRDSPGGTLEALVRLHTLLRDTMTLTPLAPTGIETDIRNFISYRPSGRPLSFTGGTFKLCDQRGARSAKSLIISETGQPRISDQKDSSGVLKDHKLTAITCP